MGVSLLVKGADFSANAVGVIPPVADNLRYINFLGTAEARNMRNLALGKGISSVRGEPVVNPGYVALRGGYDDITTSAIETGEATLLVACKWSVTSQFQNFAVGSYLGPSAVNPARSSVGLSLYVDGNNGNAITMAAGRVNNGSASPLVTSLPANTDVTPFAFYAVQAGNTIQRLRDLTRALSSGGAVSIPRDPTAQAYRLGGGYGGNGVDGRCDLAFVAIYSRVLSDAEIATMYAWTKPILASSGITV